MDLVIARPEGLYCPAGDFYIDPWRPVERSVITHAHGDHARTGNQHYLAAAPGEGILRSRLGQDINLQTLAYGEKLLHHGVTLSFHPAGHVLGSAQVRLEYQGEVWVASGDYKVEPDGTCAPFEPVRCHTFITESTFGLPIYRWQPQAQIFAGINDWWQANIAAGKASVLFCYSFGKAQRILHGIDASIGPILSHGAVEPLNRVYREAGIYIPETLYAGDFKKTDPLLRQALIIAPPVCGRQQLDQALRRLQRRLRQRLDALARHPPTTRGRPWFCAVGPRRLAGPVVGHRANRRGTGDGDPRFCRRIGTPSAGKRPGCHGFHH